MTEKKIILDWCQTLSKSQGFYSSLYDFLSSNEGQEALESLSKRDFKDITDFILEVES